MKIHGIDRNNQPTSIEVPDSIGQAILQARANANRFSSHPDGAAILIIEPNASDPHSSYIAIAADTTPAATVEINTKYSSTNPRFTIAIDTQQDQIVGPLAGKFPNLDGHTVDLKLRPKK